MLFEIVKECLAQAEAFYMKGDTVTSARWREKAKEILGYIRDRDDRRFARNAEMN